MSAHLRMKTGIDGLDLVLDGGLRYPADGSVFLVILGGPGTGKTHLALELTARILAQTEGAGHSHLFYSLDQTPSEVHAKLGEDFDYYGIPGEWSRVTATIRSDEYHALLHSVRPSGTRADERYFLCASLKNGNEAKLDGARTLFERLDRDIEAVTDAANVGQPLPARLVTIDNISLNSFDDGDGVRATLRSIRNRLAARRLHGIFVVETPHGDGNDRATFAAAEYAADVMIQLGYHRFADQFKERSIEVTKARHQFYFRGTHHFSIVGRNESKLRGARGQRPPGIHLYPSVPTLLSYLQYRSVGQRRDESDRPLGVGDFQVLSSSSNGLLAHPSEADSLRRLTFEFLLAGDSSGLLISFLHNAAEMREAAAAWFPDRDLARDVPVLSFEPEYMSSGKFLKDVHDEVEALRGRGHPVDRVAVLGLEHLRWGFPLLSDSKMLIPWLAMFFRHQDVTSLFVETSPKADRGTATASTVDNLFHLERGAGGEITLSMDRSQKGRGPREGGFALPWEL